MNEIKERIETIIREEVGALDRPSFDLKYEIEAALERMATEQRAIDTKLIDDLIGELYISRAFHLGITGLDSPAEIARKEREGDCALIRGIDRTIKYVQEAIEK